MKFQFSGHESFICKHFWLKKGYDFLHYKGSFSDDNAVVELGVGKNMVISIAYWLKAFGIVDNTNKITQFGEYLFSEKVGKDPYIERIGTLWLLHYHLIKTEKASIYSLFFNEFRRERHEFTKDQLAKFLIRRAEQEGKVSANTINGDIAVMLRNYLTVDYKNSKADVEDEFSNLLLDLELIQSYQVENPDGRNVEWYRAQNTIRPELPTPIVLYVILDNPLYGKSIPFRELLIGYNSPGAMFALNEDGLYQKIEEMTKMHKNIVYTESAGVRELQIKSNINKETILDAYYKN
ncbi:MAG: DUF4007 family protein [Bacteroidetes bacterium]|nr:DUF4007 family protein [Bacteroidota bacterium]